jgi:hypothetical protein
VNAYSSTLDLAAAAGGLDSGPASLASLCAESGWPFNERAGDCLVKLEINRAEPPFYARVERAADGAIIAWVDLTAAAQELEDVGSLEEATAPAPESPVGRRAVEAIFAEMAGRMCCVRGVFKESPIARTAGFEVHIPANSGSEQLADALAALSVACQLAGPECQLLLCDPVIAESYLAQLRRVRGCSPGRQDTPDTRVPDGQSNS